MFPVSNSTADYLKAIHVNTETALLFSFSWILFHTRKEKAHSRFQKKKKCFERFCKYQSYIVFPGGLFRDIHKQHHIRYHILLWRGGREWGAPHCNLQICHALRYILCFHDGLLLFRDSGTLEEHQRHQNPHKLGQVKKSAVQLPETCEPTAEA